MTAAQQPAHPHAILKKIVKKLSVRIVIVVVGLTMLFWWLFPRNTAPTSRLDTPASKEKATPAAKAPEDAISSEAKTAFTIAESTRSIAKSAQGRIVTLANEAKLILEEARRLAARFERTIAELERDERGRRIAASGELVDRFRALTASARTPASRVTEHIDELESLVAPMRRALSEPDNIALPDERLDPAISVMRARAGKLRAESRKLDGELDVLLRDAQQFHSPGTIGLQEAISRLEQEEARESSRLLSEARERARKEVERKRAEAEAEAIRIAGAAEANQILERARQKKEESETALAERRAEAERERLHRRARSPEVKQYLGAFFAKGYKQPREIQGAFLAFDSTAEPVPISLIRLKTLGALDKGVKGLACLCWIASDFQNDRPRWRTPQPDYWSPETREFVLRAQALLQELGPALVEEGLLAP